MSLRGGSPIDELAVPSETTVEEHDLVTDGDVLVGGQSTVEFGLRGRNVAIGERVSVENDIEAEGDCRLDTWCSVDGNVLVGEDAYLGERVTVTGRLMVSGDLDIGDDVSIEEGFEANGWIVIRNPVPTLVFYFIILSQLLRVGETDAADELAEALADGDDVREPLLIPRSAEISDDAWRVSTPATVGDDCRLHGNIRAESVHVGERNEVFGSLRAREGVTVGAETTIHGDVTTRGGTVTVEAGARILGDVSAGDLVVHDGAEIDGTLRARGEMRLIQETDDKSATAGEENDDPADEAESGDEVESEDNADDDAEATASEAPESTESTKPSESTESTEEEEDPEGDETDSELDGETGDDTPDDEADGDELEGDKSEDGDSEDDIDSTDDDSSASVRDDAPDTTQEEESDDEAPAGEASSTGLRSDETEIATDAPDADVEPT
ncbi:polymer-forming cytoskeletal protein [Halorubrum sp. DTA46]|uniref:polymer-forming cytoskeletal protein n=1 Tax=Halorubrum sp. DTA46 TaxID=3402162 RepID=UPI003AB031AA